MVVAVIAVFPRTVLNADVVVGRGSQIQPRVLVIVEAVPPERIPRGIPDVNTVRQALRWVGVAVRFVILDRRSRDASRDANSVIVIVPDNVRSDQDAG